MKRSQRKKCSLLLLLLGLSAICAAQKTFKYQAYINPVASDGLYRIYLKPDVVARCKNDLSDLRIADTKDNFTPYANGTELPGNKADFIAFTAVNQRNITDTASLIVVENTATEPINVLWLKLKNAAVQRNADLLGSDDGVNWYAIKEFIPLAESTETPSDYYVQSITFPASSYKFFKIRIDNRKKNPVNILQVGVFRDVIKSAEFDKLPTPKLERTDRFDKVTYLNLKFDLNYQIDQIKLSIASPKYFKRNVSVYQKVNNQLVYIGETELVSGRDAVIKIGAKTNSIQLQIKNDDNKPLEITKVEAVQQKKFVFAYLEKGMRYRFLLGDIRSTLPNYDLAFFTENSRDTILNISHAGIVRNPDYKIKTPEIKRNYTFLMWIGLGVAMISLLFLTYKMTMELKQKA